MAEIRQVTFTHREVAEALVRRQGIHEGHWGIYVEFGIAGANVGAPEGDDLFPAAIVPVRRLGIQRFEEANALTVDAAVVNPRKPSKESSRGRRK